jgi:hypothetical protein
MPDKSFVQKMYTILNIIKTDYVAVCADDDFIIEECTVSILKQLINNTDYSMGIGKYAGFDLTFSGFYKIYDNIVTIDDKTELFRIIRYLSNYYMSLWAIYKKDTIKKAYRILQQSNFSNHNLIEITIAITCALDGKIYCDKKLYGIREVNNVNTNNWAKQHLPILSAYKNSYKHIVNDINQLSYSFKSRFFFKAGIYCYLFYSVKRLIKKNTQKREILDMTEDLIKIQNIILKQKND